ncbi:SGNH/GDSL hydrolase family protein [Actinacidiphila yeochonensis]|uniref:SGNH/GDSL hydrolase family protein n=1 Tax=Actinacidiphila yeochonensis TaxID=89050 RepID=UPI0005629160|nr:SGNH/GDSL hydrolase family protein [Actinacidiphila yeochonensis]
MAAAATAAVIAVLVLATAVVVGVRSLPGRGGSGAEAARVAVPAGRATATRAGAELRSTVGALRSGAWEAAMSGGGPSFTDRTLRMVVHPSIGGAGLRIRLTDRYGRSDLRVGSVYVAEQEAGARPYPGTRHQVLFGGAASTVVTAGTDKISDVVPMAVEAGRDLLVSFYLPGTTGPSMYHRESYQTSYLSTDRRDHAADLGGGAFSETTTSWYYLSGLDVQSQTADGTVVAFGDSITDGYHSTLDANRRWPDELARRLAAQPGGPRLGVVDAGLAGNRLLTQAPQVYRGPAGTDRFAHDVLDQPGVRDAIVLEGVNDLSNDVNASGGPLTAADLENGYRTLIAEAHRAGVRVIGATILPYSKLSPAMEAVREEANAWIRTSGAFDAVADFDAAVRDPANPSAMLPADDSGDHLHPDDAGMRAMAAAIDLATLTS